MKHENTITRAHAYSIIDGERAYQDSLGSDRKRDVGPEISLTQAEFFTLIRVYLAKAEAAWTAGAGGYVDEAQAHVRKIAALCVASMERHGCPYRSPVKQPNLNA